MKRVLSIILVFSLVLVSVSSIVPAVKPVFADANTTVVENEEVTSEPELTTEPEESISPEETEIPAESLEPEDTESPEITATPEPVVYVLGDVDGSSVINAADALAVLKDAAQLEALDEPSSIAADVDKSGDADAKDALYILQYAARIIVRFVFTPEENLQVLKYYIKDNGVVDEQGNYTISKDYVVEGISENDVDVDSFVYNESSDVLIYKYNTAFTDDKKIFEAEYVITLGLNETDIRINWIEDYQKKYVNVEVEQLIDNENIRFQDDLSKDCNIISSKISDKSVLKSSEREEQINNDANNMIDAQMHMALLSMEDYLKNTAVIRLIDLGFKSYSYTNDDIYKKMACLYNIDINIQNNLLVIKEYLLNKGTKEGDEYYLKMTSSQSRDYYDIQSAEGDYYVVYNETYDSVYFTASIYHQSYTSDKLNGYITQVSVFPFYDRTIYYNVSIYKPDEYELEYQVEGVCDSFDIEFPYIGRYTCIYPENGHVNNNIEQLIPYDVCLSIEQVCSLIYSNTNIDRAGLGFISYNN